MFHVNDSHPERIRPCKIRFMRLAICLTARTVHDRLDADWHNTTEGQHPSVAASYFGALVRRTTLQADQSITVDINPEHCIRHLVDMRRFQGRMHQQGDTGFAKTARQAGARSAQSRHF